MNVAAEISAVGDFAERVADNVERVIFGKRREIEYLLVAMLCGGHVLIEDVPGTGKTMLARSVAVSLGCRFRRLQCTPDLLPNDITGLSVFNQRSGEFVFHPGPIFVNILLADEINRATPRTQAALLEAMQERQVSIEGETRPLPDPFLLLATQNPIEYEGTFPLPEAQLDRFLLRLPLGYPDRPSEREMLRVQRGRHPVESIEPVADGTALPGLRDAVGAVHVDAIIEEYILDLIDATRASPYLSTGASPRGSLALYKTSQALAAIRGREYVLPDDVKEMVPLVLPHRLMLRADSQLRRMDAAEVVTRILEETELHIETPAGRSRAAAEPG